MKKHQNEWQQRWRSAAHLAPIAARAIPTIRPAALPIPIPVPIAVRAFPLRAVPLATVAAAGRALVWRPLIPAAAIGARVMRVLVRALVPLPFLAAAFPLAALGFVTSVAVAVGVVAFPVAPLGLVAAMALVVIAVAVAVPLLVRPAAMSAFSGGFRPTVGLTYGVTWRAGRPGELCIEGWWPRKRAGQGITAYRRRCVIAVDVAVAVLAVHEGMGARAGRRLSGEAAAWRAWAAPVTAMWCAMAGAWAGLRAVRASDLSRFCVCVSHN